jgi:hypothetical protein
MLLFSGLPFAPLAAGRVGHDSNILKTGEEENYINRMIIASTQSYKRFRRSVMSHEHDFILSSVGNSPTNCFVRCLTCDTYFCQVCGKVLLDRADLKLHQKCN